MNLENWRPLNDSHAIERALITITFSENVSELVWHKSKSIAREQARKFGLGTENTPMVVNLNIQNATRQVNQEQDAGAIEFLKLERSNFFAERLELTKNSISYETYRYTRWSEFLKVFNGLIKLVLEKYTSVVIANRISSEYIDKFIEKEPKSSNCFEVIKRDSQYVAPYFKSNLELWHNHSGYLEKVDDLWQRVHQIDLNIAEIKNPNIDTLIKAIQIRTNVTDSINQKTKPSDAINMDQINELLVKQHEELKEILKSVLTDNAIKQIGMRQ